MLLTSAIALVICLLEMKLDLLVKSVNTSSAFGKIGRVLESDIIS